MHCKNCGIKIKNEEKFCASCGSKIDSVDNPGALAKVDGSLMSQIDCDSCHYIGPGKAGRSTFGQGVAWGFFGLPALIYYAVTKKFKCAKCGSKKYKIKRNGLFADGKKTNIAGIVLGAILVFILVRSFPSVVLASLNSARQKALEAQTSSMSNEEYIKQVVVEAKKQLNLPSKMSESTTFTDLVAEQSAIRYEYTLQGLDLPRSYDNSIFNEKMKPVLLKDTCENNSLVGFLNRGIDVKYSYLDEETNKSFLVTFTKGDCS